MFLATIHANRLLCSMLTSLLTIQLVISGEAQAQANRPTVFYVSTGSPKKLLEAYEKSALKTISEFVFNETQSLESDLFSVSEESQVIQRRVKMLLEDSKIEFEILSSREQVKFICRFIHAKHSPEKFADKLTSLFEEIDRVEFARESASRIQCRYDSKKVFELRIHDDSVTISNASDSEVAEQKQALKADRRFRAISKAKVPELSVDLFWYVNVQSLRQYANDYLKFWWKRIGLDDFVAVGGNVYLSEPNADLIARTQLLWAQPTRKIGAMATIEGSVDYSTKSFPRGMSFGLTTRLNKKETLRGVSEYLKSAKGHSLNTYYAYFDKYLDLDFPAEKVFAKGFGNEVGYFSRVVYGKKDGGKRDDALLNAHSHALVIELDDEELVKEFFDRFVEFEDDLYSKVTIDGVTCCRCNFFSNYAQLEFLVPFNKVFNDKGDGLPIQIRHAYYAIVDSKLIYVEDESTLRLVLKHMLQAGKKQEAEYDLQKSVRMAKKYSSSKGAGQAIVFYCVERELNLVLRQLQSRSFRDFLSQSLGSKTNFHSKPSAASVKKLQSAYEAIGRPFVTTISKQENGFSATTVLRSQSRFELGRNQD